MQTGGDGATFRFTAELWRWKAQNGWFFVTVPADHSATVRSVPRAPRGFGSVRVRATVPGPGPKPSVWETSIFPDSAKGCYVLPVKKSVRTAHDLDDGDPVDLVLEVLE
jgi:hypothetical protein